MAVSAPAQEQHMPQSEPTQSEQAAAFDNWLEQAGPRIAWRNDTINAIVQRMAPQLAQLPEGGTTAADLAMGLHRMSDGQLQAATAHQQLLDFEAAINQGVAAPSAKIAGGVDKAGLGDGSNLVFVPITPCRIADSRKADEGKLQRNVVRSYYKYPISNHGAESGCGSDHYSSIGNGDGISPALALTVTATQAEGSGHLSIKPFSFFSSFSETSVLNFRPGETIANSTVVAARTMDAPNLPDFWITPSQPCT
ncbi:hypothetical protein CK621_14515 [Vandammella animalimorsus]|uniref:Uncharacterized protein n=2 Tax=Vandammella animalimorsus TaxID=2029117 RepID=A0A2A2AQ11_9BURK|nr:hypothetical protein CK621_14515 [Vandammella animalimorsus]